MLADPTARNGFEWRMTAHGVTTMSDYFRELCRYNLVGLADRVSMPALPLAGEGDFAGTGQLQTFADALAAPVATHTFTVAEGAGGHCEGLGQDLLDQYAYRVAGRGPGRPTRCGNALNHRGTEPRLPQLMLVLDTESGLCDEGAGPPLLVTPGSCSGCSHPTTRGGPCERTVRR